MQAKYLAFSAQTHPEKQRPSVISWALHAPLPALARLRDEDCFTSASVIQQTLGYLPGDIALFPEMSGKAFVNFLARYRGMKKRGRVKELTDRFELDLKQPIRRMSKGDRQKLALVCAFMHDPSIVILDEPTASLDLLMQHAFIDLILEERKKERPFSCPPIGSAK